MFEFTSVYQSVWMHSYLVHGAAIVHCQIHTRFIICVNQSESCFFLVIDEDSQSWIFTNIKDCNSRAD